MSLFRRAVAVNVTVLVTAALLLALSPATISATVTRSEWIVLAAGTAAVIVVNLLLLRRVFGPLERLEQVMGRIDPHEPGRRIREGQGDHEIASVSRAFNSMLDRLERERADGRRRALRAQEAERGRVARELHDEVGQLLTGVVLQLEGLAAAVPAPRRGEVEGIQDNVRQGVQTVREIARGLRPPALEEFGLRASLVALGAGFSERTGLRVRHRIDPALPSLDAETELALYRVAQEAMTNVARHACASEVELLLRSEHHGVALTVADDGQGISTDDLNSSHGVAGMRERALLVGGTLEIRRRAPRGSEVRLVVPDPMSSPRRTRILIADDHTLVRSGLRMILDAAPDLEVVAEAADGVEAVEHGLREDVDLAVLDVAMPGRTGLHAARELARQRPGLRLLMLSMHDEELYCLQALKAGASGYVLKSAAERDLVEACRAAMRGETFLYPPTVRSLLRAWLDDPTRAPASELTAREEEVVKLVAESHTSEEIADLLHISRRTVERHRENILAKLGLTDRIQLTRYAIRRGLIDA